MRRTQLESIQAYKDSSPFLNPPDHPAEQGCDEMRITKCHTKGKEPFSRYHRKPRARKWVQLLFAGNIVNKQELRNR